MSVNSEESKDRLKHAAHFRDLVAYQKARQLSQDIFDATRTFPGDERFSLTDQIRRSSRSIGAQIAEAWGKRRYEKHFISKLTDADSEAYETQHWIIVAFDAGHIDADQAKVLYEQCRDVGRLIGGIINKASQFCNQSPYTIREATPAYFISNEGKGDFAVNFFDETR